MSLNSFGRVFCKSDARIGNVSRSSVQLECTAKLIFITSFVLSRRM